MYFIFNFYLCNTTRVFIFVYASFLSFFFNFEICVFFKFWLQVALRDVTSLRRSAEKNDFMAQSGVFRPNLVSFLPSLTPTLERLLAVAAQARSDAGSSGPPFSSSLVDLIDYALSGLSAQLDHAREHCPAETFTATLKADFERTRSSLINGICECLPVWFGQNKNSGHYRHALIRSRF